MAPVAPRWPTFGYVPVPAISQRLWARYFRAQRKTLRRLFLERGLFDLVERMERIKHSRQGTDAKNVMFQEVLGAYAQRATATSAAPEAAPAVDRGNDPALDLRAGIEQHSGVGAHDGGSLPQVENQDGGGVVIDE